MLAVLEVNVKGLLGYKVGMTQIIDDNGVVTPVTIIQAGPCYVTQVKTSDTEGYSAIQVGFGVAKEKSLSNGEKGHLGHLKGDKKQAIPLVRHLREFRTEKPSEYEVGQVLTVDVFQTGDKIDVTGKTKGRGFAGAMKRHGFRGGPKTHGQSDRGRAPGSIGPGSTIARVTKGRKMAGHMGDARHTAQNLEVVRIDAERNLIAIKGAVPGAKGGLVIIRPAAKSGK